jgi:signal transduction histidine kinase
MFTEYIENIKTGNQFRGRAIDLHKDGTPFFVEVTGKQFIYQGEPHALAVLRDVTEQVQAYQLLEKRVQERTREIAALLEVGRNVASTLDLSLLLELVLSQLKTVVDYTGAGIATLDGENFVFLDYQGPTPREAVINLHIPANLPSGYQEVVRTREAVIIPDIWDTSSQSLLIKQHSTDSMKTCFGYVRSWLGVPLMVKDRFIGVLRIDHEQPNCFDQGHAQLVLAFANQAAVAIENARLYQRAQSLAVLEERQRLARELHDSVSQALYGIALGARTARTLLEREKIDDKELTEPIDYVMSLAQAGLAEMRALIFELRPESLETEGLVAALVKHAEALKARHQIDVSLDLCDEPPVALEVKEILYRVAQEALHNTIKHAQATQIEVRLASENQQLVLEVGDNGIGFDPAQEFPGHLGLLSMRERVEGTGGRFVIESAYQQGTKIRAQIPLADS